MAILGKTTIPGLGILAPVLSAAKRFIVSDYVRSTSHVIETGVRNVESWVFSVGFGKD